MSFALLAASTARMRAYTAELTKDVWKLEQQVTDGHLGDPETFVDEMFRGPARPADGRHHGRAEGEV